MKLVTSGALALALVASSAAAQTVYDTSLQNLNGATYATTTTANGTTTSSSGARVDGAPVTGQWFQNQVGGGGAVGITKTFTNDGDGAAFFHTTDANSKADLVYRFDSAVLLSTLETVSFDYYRDASSANWAPVLRLLVTEEGGGGGSLVLEHVYQNQTAVPAGWSTINADLDSGIFWTPSAGLGPTFASANGGQKPLTDWMSANSTLRVVGLSIGVGSGWAGTFDGAVDHVAIEFTDGPSQNFNFAVASVPEPTTWALMIGGFGMAGAALRRRRTLAA